MQDFHEGKREFWTLYLVRRTGAVMMMHVANW